MNDLPEYEGFWWSPDDPESQIAGRLIADGGTAQLILTIDKSEHLQFLSPRTREYEILYGRTSDGNLITLLKCFDQRTSWSTSGIEKRVILANYVLVGDLVPRSRVENAFNGLAVTWPDLQRWFLESGLTVEYDESDVRSFTIKYRAKQKFGFEYSKGLSIEFVFGTDKLPFGGLLAEQVEFKEIVWVVLRKDTPESMDYFLDRLYELIHFFSICALKYNQPQEVTLIGDFNIKTMHDGTKMPPHLKVYFSSVQQSESEAFQHPAEMLVPYRVIKDDFQKILKSWAEVANVISPSRFLYFSSLYGTNRYIESAFLSLAQAAEVFHRRMYGGTYIPDLEYRRNVLPRLTAAIPNDVNSDVRRAYMQKLQYANEYSLSKRLKMMASNHKGVFSVYVPDWKDTIRSIVTARNYYTHYSEGSEHGAPSTRELVKCREFLRTLLELEMLAVAGVDVGVLHKQALECQRYRMKFGIVRNSEVGREG